MTSTAVTPSVELLLVEDDTDDARHIQRLLSAAGIVSSADRTIEFEAIDHVTQLAAALDALADRTPDVVLLDLCLPDSDGLQTLERVIADAPTVPVVVLTGSADTDLGPGAIRVGAQDYLRKGSITDELLRRTLRYAIDRHERTREIAITNRRLRLLNRIVRRDLMDDAGVIVGRTDELRDHVDRDGAANVDGLLETAHDVVDRIETVAAIMDALSTGPDVEREPVDIAAIVEEEAAGVRDRHDVELTVHRDGDEEPLVAATPMLSSVVRQLLSNAVLHTDRESPSVTVSVDASPDEVSVTIADDGVGMSDSRKRGLDDLGPLAHDEADIGTGLFLVLAVLDRIDGDVEFADNEPVGTVVTVTLDRYGAT